MNQFTLTVVVRFLMEGLVLDVDIKIPLWRWVPKRDFNLEKDI